MARGRDPGFAVVVKLTDQFTKPIQGVNASIAKATAGLRGIAKLPGALAQATGLNKIGSAAANVGRSFVNLRNSIAGAVAPFARLATIGAGVGLVAATANAVKLGDELVALSKKTGVGIESIQRLQYAAKQSGVSADAMTGSLTKMQKSVAAGLSGNKKTAKAWTALGISVKDLQTLSPEQLFLKTATAISNISNPTYKAAAATAVYGKSGVELIPVLNEGAAGIAKLGDELAATGAIMTTDTALAAKKFSDTMLKMQQYIQGIAFSVLGELLPAMTGAADATDKWLAANKAWIVEEVTAVVRGLASAAKALYRIIRDDVVPIVKSMEPVWTAVTSVIGKGNAVLLALVSVVAPGVIGALFGIGKAVIALGVALVANPIGAAIIAVVAAIAVAAYLIWKHWDTIKQTFWEAIEWIKGAGRDFTAGFVTDAWDPLVGFFSGLWQGARSTFDTALAWLADFETQYVSQPIIAAWEALPGFLSAIWNAPRVAFDAAVAWLAGFVADFVPQPIINAWNALPTAVNNMWKAVTGFFERAYTTIKGIVGSIVAAIQPLLGAISAVGGAIGGIGGWVGNKLGFGGGGGAPAAAPPAGSGAAAAAQAAPAGGGAAALGRQANAPAQQTQTDINVNFSNVPAGTRIGEQTRGPADVTLNTAYAGPRGALAGAY